MGPRMGWYAVLECIMQYHKVYSAVSEEYHTCTKVECKPCLHDYRFTILVTYE